MEILQFALIAIGLFYLVITVYSLLRLVTVYKSKNSIKISIAFYSGMLIASSLRATTLYIISVNTISTKESTADDVFLIYMMIIIPDMVNICVYLFLIWYFFANFILSHINLANDLALFSKIDEPSLSGKTYTLLYIMLPIYFVVFVIVNALTYTNDINNDALYIINSYFNLFTPVLAFAYYIFLLVKFSGRPYYNDTFKGQIRKMSVIVLIWSIARMFTGILGLIRSGSFINEIINNFDDESSNTIYCFSILVYFIISEYIPNFAALDHSFMMTYLKNQQEASNDQEIFLESSSLSNKKSEDTSDFIHMLNSPKTFRRVDPKVDTLKETEIIYNENLPYSKTGKGHETIPGKRTPNEVMVKIFADINLLEQIYSKKNGLGVIYKSNMHNTDTCCRVLKFERLSRYDLEGFSKDIDELINLYHKNVCPVTGICVENIPNIYILSPYFKDGSLYDFLHAHKNKLDPNKQLEMALGIAYGMEYLQNNMIPHLHLSSRNVYLDEDLSPLISDYGLHYLKDISSVFLKYKNKNSYCCPELLKDSKTITNVTSNKNNLYKCDVYSFGIVLWEIYACTIPFNINLTNLYNYVVVNQYRPEITSDFPTEVASLIRQCWDEDPNKRPNFKKIIEVLEIIKHNK